MAEQASRCPLKACCKVCWTITGNRGECCWCFFTIFLEMLMDLQLNINGLWMFFLQGFLGYGWCKKRKRRHTFFKNPMKSYALKLIIECTPMVYDYFCPMVYGSSHPMVYDSFRPMIYDSSHRMVYDSTWTAYFHNDLMTRKHQLSDLSFTSFLCCCILDTYGRSW